MTHVSVLPLRMWQLGVLGLAALTGVVAGVSPMLGLAFALGVAYLLIVATDLMAALVIFAGLTFLESVEGFGALSLAKAAGALLGLAWLAIVATDRSEKRLLPSDHPGLTLLAVAFGTWALLSATWAELPGEATSSATRWVLNLVLLLIVYVAVREAKHVRWIFWVFIIGSLGSTAMGLVTGAGTGDRLEGSGVNSNYLGEMLILTVVLAATLAANRQVASPARYLAAGCTALAVAALLATLSRGALVGMVVSLLVAPLLIGPGRRIPTIVFGASAAALAVLAVLTFAPAQAVERLSGQSDTTGSGRTDIWKVGLRMYRANPILGVGAGNFANRNVDYLLEPGVVLRSDHIIDKPKDAHNVYLQAAAELGTIGLLLFLTLMAAALRQLLVAARRFRAAGDRSSELLARGLLIGMIGHLASLFFSTAIYSKQLWLMLALSVAIGAIARERPDQRPESRATPATGS